jgi:hypothetical protein
MLCPNVPPPATPGRSSTRSGPGCCLLPSPGNDRLGPPKHLSADTITRLQRSLVVAARWFASLSFKSFRHSAWLGRISPSGRSLLPGAPALTRTGLSPARTSRLSGRTIGHQYNANGRIKDEYKNGRLKYRFRCPCPTPPCESPIEHYPRGSVVARVFLSTNPSVYAPMDQPLGHGGREKEMIQAHPLV